VPGTLNYVEGQASIGKEVLTSKSVGSAESQPGQSLDTGNGKAEVLLTPGVFLRVGDNSSITMILPSLTSTQVSVNKGEAMVEVAEIHPENYIRVTEDGATAQMLKTGVYDFDQKQHELRVFDAKALVDDGGAQVKVKSGRELSLASGAPLKAEKFDKDAYQEGDLYRWSDLRAEYLAEANVDAARIYEINGWGPWGPGWWGRWMVLGSVVWRLYLYTRRRLLVRPVWLGFLFTMVGVSHRGIGTVLATDTGLLPPFQHFSRGRPGSLPGERSLPLGIRHIARSARLRIDGRLSRRWLPPRLVVFLRPPYLRCVVSQHGKPDCAWRGGSSWALKQY
jgi:FecR protein